MEPSSLKVGVFQDNLEKINWHYHDYYEISFITEGTGKRFVADTMDTFFPGDLVFVGPNIPHAWVVDKEQVSTNTRKLEMVYLQFPTEIVNSDFFKRPEFLNINRAISLSEKGIRITDNTLNKVSEIMLQLPYNNDFERFLLFLKIMNTIGSSTEFVPLCSDEYCVNRLNVKNKRIETIHEYLMKNHREQIQLKQIANLVYMTEGALCRYFKSQMGLTIFEYLNQIKIDFACKLLMNRQLNIVDIALDSGFNNLSYFNKQFKTLTKMTPLEYRKNLGS